MPCLCGGRRAQDEARRGCGMAWHVVSLRRSSSHKRETRAVFVLTRRVPSTNSVRRPEKSAARLCLAAMDVSANRSAGWRGQSFQVMEGGTRSPRRGGCVRSREGGRDGISGRGEGGLFFFCGFGKRKPPERERLGLKLERARLMTDQFCAAGSQAQRGAACARVPDFPLCGGWEWVGCGCWAVGAGQWALGIAGNPHSGGVVAAVHPLVERWSGGAAAGGQGQPNRTNSRLADGRQKNSTQSQH